MAITIQNPIQALKTQLEAGDSIEFRPGVFMQKAEFCSPDTRDACHLLDDGWDGDEYIITTDNGVDPEVFNNVDEAISEIVRWWTEDLV